MEAQRQPPVMWEGEDMVRGECDGWEGLRGWLYGVDEEGVGAVCAP